MFKLQRKLKLFFVGIKIGIKNLQKETKTEFKIISIVENCEFNLNL